MPQVLIRNVDTDVLDRLKERARRNGRSLQGELTLVLRQASGLDMEAARAEAARIRAMFSGREFADSTALVREDRDHAH